MSKSKSKIEVKTEIQPKGLFANQPIHVVSDRTFRSAYSPQLVVTTSCSSSKTEQSHLESTDINKIFHASNHSPEILIPDAPPTFGDFSNVADFTEMQNRVADAISGFEALPAETRAFFDHKPANLVEFMNDPDNAQDAINMGLIELEPESLDKYLNPKDDDPKDAEVDPKIDPKKGDSDNA